MNSVRPAHAYRSPRWLLCLLLPLSNRDYVFRLYSACIAPVTPEPRTLLSLEAILLPFNIPLWGAACSWNDTVDRDFDRRVERCQHRPVARSVVSTTGAHMFTLAQLAAGYLILGLFPEPRVLHMLITAMLAAVYALMKRITGYPQPWAWSFSANMPYRPTLALFGANVLWIVAYDTIYAHQSVADDERVWVKSLALRFNINTKMLVSMPTAGQVGVLSLCGLWAGFSAVYFTATVCDVTAAMAYYIS
ncbi:hypothetical protein AAE478_008671 [Parahypoxylon ruwenzoriense]